MSSTSDRKSKHFFANCVSCDGIVRVPIAIRPNSDVNCPHCGARCEFGDLTDQIPEVQVIVDDDSSPESEFQIDESIEQQDGKFVVPPQLAAGIKKRRRRRRRSSSSSSSSASSSSSPSSSASEPSQQATPVVAPKQLTEAEENKQHRKEERIERKREEFQQKRQSAANPAPRRPRRPSSPKRNPVAEALRVAIGGALAAPIAYLLLMWVFSRDPLHLVPTINSFAPILVPDKLVLDDDEVNDAPKARRGGSDLETDEADETETDDFFKGLPEPEANFEEPEAEFEDRSSGFDNIDTLRPDF